MVVCVGEGAYAEKKGDLKDLALPAGVEEFVKDVRKVADATTPIVLVLVQGRPRLLGDLPRVVSDNLGSMNVGFMLLLGFG